MKFCVCVFEMQWFSATAALCVHTWNPIVARSSDGLVNVAWVVLHCNRRIGARERRQLIPHVRFQVPFLGPEWRASSVPTLYACCLTKRSCHFLFVARVGLCCWFCDFAVSFLVRSHFWYRQTVPKMRPWKCFSFVFLLSGACGPKNGTAWRSHFWDRVQVHFLKFVVSRLQKRNVLVSMKLCGLCRPEGQLYLIRTLCGG